MVFIHVIQKIPKYAAAIALNSLDGEMKKAIPLPSPKELLTFARIAIPKFVENERMACTLNCFALHITHRFGSCACGDYW